MSGQPDANGAAQLAYLYRVLDENERLTRGLDAEAMRVRQRQVELEKVRHETRDKINALMKRMDCCAPRTPATAGYFARLDSLLRMLAVHQAVQNPPINPNEAISE